MILESESWGFFKNRTDIPDYDKVLDGKLSELPKYYAGWVGRIKFMSPEKYFREVADMQKTSYARQFEIIRPQNVDKIAANMRDGVKYSLPYLDYVNNTQEGRHRVKAAWDLGQEMVPVLILYKEREVEEPKVTTSISGMLGKWDDLVKDGNDYYFKASGTGWGVLDKILSCIASGYDYYFLDRLIYMKTYPSLYPNELSLIKDRSGTEYVDKYYINYDGDMEVSEDELKLCVVLRGLRNNSDVIRSIRKDGNDYYLPVPSNMRGDFDNYDSCMDMLKHLGRKYYIQEYGLLSSDDRNSLYDIQDADIQVIKGLLANKKN